MPFQDLQSKPSRPLLQFPRAKLDFTLGRYGFQPVGAADIEAFHDLADQLIEGEIASAAAIARVQAWTGRSLHMRFHRGLPDALLASIPLTEAGRAALLDGRFGFENAREGWVCTLDQPAVALLSWAMAGRTPMAQLAALRGLLAGWYHFYRDIRVYARARSLKGRALMKRLHFVEIGRPDGTAPLYGSTRFPARLARHLSATGRQAEEYQHAQDN